MKFTGKNISYDEDIDLSVENYIVEYCNAKPNGAGPPQFVATQNTASDEMAKEVMKICKI
jgi:hypothetical protein